MSDFHSVPCLLTALMPFTQRRSREQRRERAQQGRAREETEQDSALHLGADSSAAQEAYTLPSAQPQPQPQPRVHEQQQQPSTRQRRPVARCKIASCIPFERLQMLSADSPAPPAAQEASTVPSAQPQPRVHEQQQLPSTRQRRPVARCKITSRIHLSLC